MLATIPPYSLILHDHSLLLGLVSDIYEGMNDTML